MKVFSGVSWEKSVGYCRALRVGQTIEVSGTVAMDQGQVVAERDLYGQTRFILQRILDAIAELGAQPEHVVRTRMYVTDISLWEEAGRAHGEFFGSIQPVTTMVEVSALIDPRLLIEIEATAILP